MIRRIEVSLAAAGFKLTRDSVAGRQTVVARPAAVRRRPVVLVGMFKADATPDHLDRFSDEAVQYVRTVGGGPRRGVCAVAVAVVDSAVDVAGWAAGTAGERAAYPVLVDVDGCRVHSPGATRGGVHGGYLKELIQGHVIPALGRGNFS